MALNSLHSTISEISIEDTEILRDSEVFSLVRSHSEITNPFMDVSSPPLPRTLKYQEEIKCYDERILALQQSVDRDIELIRHLVASRAVAVEHEKVLSRIDEKYGNPEGRERILERIGCEGGSVRGGEGSVRGSLGSKGSMKGEEGVKEVKKEKQKLILYGKRGIGKNPKGNDEKIARRLTYHG